MGMPNIAPNLFVAYPNEPPRDISLVVPSLHPLEFIYYALVRERFGEMETFYEYTMEEGAQGNFQIILPRPPYPLEQWTLCVFGYRNRTRVFEVERPAREIF